MNKIIGKEANKQGKTLKTTRKIYIQRKVGYFK